MKGDGSYESGFKQYWVILRIRDLVKNKTNDKEIKSNIKKDKLR